jgi:hypothetical protein
MERLAMTKSRGVIARRTLVRRGNPSCQLEK